MELAVESHRLLRPEAAQQFDLLGRPRAAVAEVLTKSLVLDGVPADADAQAEPATAEKIDFGRLLRDQRRLALRQDDDPGDELERSGDRGEVAIHHERLVECGVHVVGAVPTLVHPGVRADDVVIDEDVAEAELLHAFAVRAHRARVATEFRLRERHSNSHVHIPLGRLQRHRMCSRHSRDIMAG